MSGPIQSQPTRQAPAKIDPDMMPNPISVMKENRDKYGGSVYGTSQATPPPLVTTPFTVHDQGSSSPRYIRSTLYTVPCTKDLVNQCRIPLGVIIQPLAEVPMTEVMAICFYTTNTVEPHLMATPEQQPPLI
jgi:protein transport protein SEC24